MRWWRRLRMWFYIRIMGHLPVGTLVRFKPKGIARDVLLNRFKNIPDFGAVGYVVGGWKYYRSPGYTDFGTRVMFSDVIRDVYCWDLEVIDESG